MPLLILKWLFSLFLCHSSVVDIPHLHSATSSPLHINWYSTMLPISNVFCTAIPIFTVTPNSCHVSNACWPSRPKSAPAKSARSQPAAPEGRHLHLSSTTALPPSLRPCQKEKAKGGYEIATLIWIPADFPEFLQKKPPGAHADARLLLLLLLLYYCLATVGTVYPLSTHPILVAIWSQHWA